MRQHHAVHRLVVVEKHLNVDDLRRGCGIWWRPARAGPCRSFVIAASLRSVAGGRRSTALRLHHDSWRRAAVLQHQRTMALLVEEDAGGEAALTFRVDDIG